MLAIQVDLLTDRYAASRHDDRDRVEWPPHPARLFSALVAVWADAEVPDAEEARALEWLEEQGAPDISCTEAAQRSPVTHFVPDNDVSVARRDLSRTYGQLVAAAQVVRERPDDTRAARSLTREQARAVEQSRKQLAAGADSAQQATDVLRVLPEQRGRQGRSYPVAVPDEPCLVFVWPAVEAAEPVVRALDALLSRVGRIGHSSSLVSCRLVHEVPTVRLTPAPPSAPLAETTPLRVAAPGLLRELRREHEHHRGSQPRALPAAIADYWAPRVAADDPPRSALAGEWLPLALTGRPVTIAGTQALTRAARAALLAHGPQPSPAVLSGHLQGPDPSPPSAAAHLAVVALPFVGSAHADGTIKGIALLLPATVAAAERDAVLAALDRWLADGGRLWGGSVPPLTLDTPAADRTTGALRASRWSSASHDWLSVTPVALDRVPAHWSRRHGRADATVYEEAAQVVAASCLHVGLPRPESVVVRFDSTMTGVPPVRRFPPYQSSSGGARRVSVHVAVRFAEPVAGPLLLGAGRYHGLGLFAPADRP